MARHVHEQRQCRRHRIERVAIVTVLSFVIGVVFSTSARPAPHANTSVEIGSPVWSPRRAEIALTASFDEQAMCGVESGRDAGAPPKRDVFIVNADGSGLRRVAPSAPYDWRWAPKWSPDANRLTVALWTSRYNHVERGAQVITRTGRIVFSEVPAEPAGWVLDSQHLAINQFDPTDSPTQIVIRDLRSGAGRVLGPYWFGDIFWSSQSHLLAYASNGFINTARVNGKGRRRVLRAADVFALQWSGDGRMLGYQGTARRAYGPVYVISPDGSNRRTMTRTPDSSWSWSPRGRVLALNRVLIDFTSGKRWSVLPSRISGVRDVTWSPDGRMLAYVVRAGIYTVDVNGRRGRMIRSPKKLPTSDLAWSHDARTLAFTTQRGVYKVGADGRHRGYIPLRWCDAASG
jgi:Tol biopolymer transport system component